MQVKILRNVIANNKPQKIGQVVEVDEYDARILIGEKSAEPFKQPPVKKRAKRKAKAKVEVDV